MKFILLTDARGDHIIVRVEYIHSVTRGTFKAGDAEFECTYVRMSTGTSGGGVGGDFFRVSETVDQVFRAIQARG